MAKLLSDTEYTNMSDESAPYFVQGSMHDELWGWLPPAEELKKAA